MQLMKTRLALLLSLSSLSGAALAQNNAIVIQNGEVISSKNDAGTSGAETSEVRAIEAFDSVELSAPAQATFTFGPKSSITVTAPADILQHVTTDVKGGRLEVSIKGSVIMTKSLKVAIVGPALKGVSIPGSGSFTVAGLKGESIDLRIPGSGSISAAGELRSVRIDIAGSGEVDTRAVPSKMLEARISGSGSVRAYASDTASVSVSGSGSVRIAGNPAHKIVKKTGAGDIRFE
jgi:hypothetical protein